MNSCILFQNVFSLSSFLIRTLSFFSHLFLLLTDMINNPYLHNFLQTSFTLHKNNFEHSRPKAILRRLSKPETRQAVLYPTGNVTGNPCVLLTHMNKPQCCGLLPNLFSKFNQTLFSKIPCRIQITTSPMSIFTSILIRRFVHGYHISAASGTD